MDFGTRIYKLKKYENKLNNLYNGSLNDDKIKYVFKKLSLYGGVRGEIKIKQALSGEYVNSIIVDYGRGYSELELEYLMKEKFNLDVEHITLLNDTVVIFDSFLLPDGFVFDESIKELKIIKQRLNPEIIKTIKEYSFFRRSDGEIKNFINQIKEMMSPNDNFKIYAKYMVSQSMNGTSVIQYLDEFIDDEDFMKNIVNYRGKLLQIIPHKFRYNKEIVLAAVKQKSRSLEYASNELRNDKDVVVAAITKDGVALQYASEDLKEDEKIVSMAIKQNIYALNYASENLKNNKEFLLNLIEQKASLFKIINNEFKDDKDFVLEAIRRNTGVFNIIAECIKNI